MKRAALIGDPVEHSLSPVMHNAAFAALGIDAMYELWPTFLGELPARIRSLRRVDILGANVTIPHKQAVMPLCDELSETARRIGAVNTLILRDDRITGDNTDAYGFARTLDAVCAGSPLGGALILGAGGAARAVAVALIDAGVTSVTIANRTRPRADALVDALRGAGASGIGVIEWHDIPRTARDAALLVNATSIGWHGEEMPVSRAAIDALDTASIVIDLTYRETALLRSVRERGIVATDGLPMLIHQGARSLELWTGEQPPVEVMTRAVLDEQARRAG